MERLTKGERFALIIFALIVVVSLFVSYFWHRKADAKVILSDSIKYQIEKFEAEIDSFTKLNNDSLIRKKNKKKQEKSRKASSINKYDNNIDPKKNPLERTNEKK